MKLSEVFTQLAYGEFSQLALGAHTNGELDAANYPALVSHVSLGLTALYKRFNLKEGRATIPLVEGSTLYKLQVTDLHKVERVTTAEDADLGLNDYSDPYSCFMVSMDTLRVPQAIAAKSQELPESLKTNGIVAVYRANHPQLVYTEPFDPDAVELELPYSHLEALLYFVASRAHTPIGMVNEFNAGNNWAAKYEAECLRLKESGMELDPENHEHTRLHANGWV
jgi:hypothetical protein